MKRSARRVGYVEFMVSWHTAAEFLGMTDREARAWAGALGWGFRDRTQGGLFADDLRSDRINVFFGADGTVVDAHIG